METTRRGFLSRLSGALLLPLVPAVLADALVRRRSGTRKVAEADLGGRMSRLYAEKASEAPGYSRTPRQPFE